MKKIVSQNIRVRNRKFFTIGKGSIIDDFSYFSPKIKVGNFTHIAANCHIGGGVDYEFEIGNPVRARIVQNLRNQTSKMNMPNPSDRWELAVVEKLMTEIERIVLAEVTRNNQKQVADSGLSEIQRQELIAETEARVINTMALEIQEALIADLTPRLEQEIRAQVESELWQQFEQEWKNRMDKN